MGAGKHRWWEDPPFIFAEKTGDGWSAIIVGGVRMPGVTISKAAQDVVANVLRERNRRMLRLECELEMAKRDRVRIDAALEAGADTLSMRSDEAIEAEYASRALGRSGLWSNRGSEALFRREYLGQWMMPGAPVSPERNRPGDTPQNPLVIDVPEGAGVDLSNLQGVRYIQPRYTVRMESLTAVEAIERENATRRRASITRDETPLQAIIRRCGELGIPCDSRRLDRERGYYEWIQRLISNAERLTVSTDPPPES